MSDLKNVVVLGLGQSGITAVKALAKSLPSTHRLVVVHPHEFSFYPIASLRAHTVSGWEKKVAVSLKGLFRDGSRHLLLENTKVVELKEGVVVVDKAVGKSGLGPEIPFEYAVVATGATYAPHCQVPDGMTGLSDLQRLYSTYQAEIQAATSILVVGAGATGIEAAGEFKEFYPDKAVTIVSSGPSFLPILKPSVSSTIEKKFKELGVKVVFNATANVGGKSGKIEKTTFDLGGTKVEADYIFVAYGFKPNSGFVNSDLLNEKGLIKVAPTLQVAGLPGVFAAGDVNDVAEMKLAYNAINQGGVVAANVLSLVQGKSATKIYKPFSPAGFITLGSKAGTGQLFGWGLPNWFVVKMKAATLRTEVWEKEFVPLTY